MDKNFKFDLQRFADLSRLQHDGNTYCISSVADLNTLAAYVNDGNDCEGLTFKQTQDITFKDSDGNFTAIGWHDYDNGKEYYFKGTYDGGNFSIENLTIIGEDYQGLFGFVDGGGGTVKDVHLVNANISGEYYVGGLVGWNNGTVSGTITNSEIIGYDYIGGLVGYNAGGYVIGRSDVGELVGFNSKGTIDGCLVNGVTVSGTGD